jgi:hypothetical protein
MPRVAAQGDEAPWHPLSVVGHPAGRVQDAQERVFVRSGPGQLAGRDGTATVELGQGRGAPGTMKIIGSIGRHGSQNAKVEIEVTHLATMLTSTQ